MVQAQNGLFHGFAIDQPNNLLVRFDFGNSPDNTPTVVSLGNPGSRFQNPLDIHFISEGNNWFALVANTAGNNLLRLNFGSDLTSVPSVTDLGSIGGLLQSPGGVNTIRENENLYAFISNGSTSQIISLSFGNSILNAPTSSVIPVPGSSGLRSMDFIRECNRWFGVITSYNSGSLFYLDFQNGAGLPPVVNQLIIPGASYSFPASVKLGNEGGDFFAFIQSAFPAHVYRIAFGESITDLTGSFTNLGNFGISNDNGAFELVEFSSSWRGFSIDLSGTIPGAGRLYRFNFPETCSTPLRIFNGPNPPSFTYSTAGTYRVTLKSVDESGNIGYRSRVITISSGVSPDIDFESQNICSNYPVNFTSINSSSTISSFEWNFGDFNTSIQQNPVYTYNSAGRFVVELNVIGLNGCTNVVQRELSMYNEPLANFSLPGVSPICSNQTYQFLNTTQYDTELNPSWQWFLNGVPVSSSFNLESSFSNPISQTIKLVSSIPGCANEVVKVIPSVNEGPVVDFSFTGQCQDTPVGFVNQSTGSINSYGWNFGDGQSSALINPVNLFAVPGNYTVTLTAFGATGCNNTRTKPITIYSKPQTNFSVALPPFSCSGTPTQFTDLTPNPFDSNITSWLWNFGEGGTSTLRNPQHTFTNAGGYNVSLTATTNFGCSSVLEKPVTISQSPIANFTNTPPCLGVPVSFTNTSTGTLQSQQWQIESTFYTLANPVHAFTSSGNKSVTLNVTATNGCVASVNRTLIVPNTISPDFTFTRNCINQQTEFTSNTVNPADPITGYNWNFAGLGTGNLNPQNFSFNNTGNFNVSLSVTTQTGCVYSVAKNVSIINAPQANFTATPSVGPPPLQVQFTNTSVNATSYSWAFNDPTNSTSTLVSPSFTYTTLGQYVADLTAFNAQGCSTIFSRVIHVVIPVIDVALTEMELMRLPDQTIKPAVTIQNKSNVALANLSLRMELNGTFIRDIVPVSIEPNSTYRHVFDFELPFTSTLQTVCVHAEINDSSPEDNRICASVDEPFVFLAPYPNPLSSQSEINVEWVASDNRNTEILLVNSLGQQVKRLEATSSIGYNVVIIPGSGLQSGMYYVQIRYGSIIRTHRILVAD